MTEFVRPPRFPPVRQARGTVLNTIIEDTREILGEKGAGSPPHTAKPAISPKLTLKTKGLSVPTHARLARLMSPLSADTTSSCSDTEWQEQMQGFDDLYDATDDEEMDDDHSTDISVSDSCFSAPGTRPSSLVTPITRNSVTSTGSNRKRALTLDIPSSPSAWHSVNATCKLNSPIPPTPPPKIPVSPAALSMLARSVPASHAPPSLDGSISSDQESNLSALATPDTHSLPDTNWDVHDIHVRPDLDGSERGDLQSEGSSPNLEEVPIALESPHQDWRNVLGQFPQIPSTLANDATEELSREPTPSDGGLFLPDSALAMLQHIPLNGTPEAWSETSSSNDEMWQLQAPPSRPRSAEGATPASELSSYSFSELSIPSPGGFFASLAPRARHTWSIPNHNHPPTSATAEGFYNLPWRQEQGEIIEQVVDWPARPEEDDPDTAIRDDPLTAIRVPCDTPTQAQQAHPRDSPISAAFDAVQEIPRSANAYEYDECYDKDLQDRAADNLDRTSVWLAAQATYMSALNETNPVNEIESPEETPDIEYEEVLRDPEAGPKKAVRFVEGIPEAISPRPPILSSKDSIYWRGFQSIRQRADKMDGFLHRNMRFDAIQSFRLGLVDMHINCLTGKYELVRAERPAYKGPFSKAPRNSIITTVLAEKAQFSKLEKEQLVLAQLCQPMWAIDAMRCLNGGKLLTSPAAKQVNRSRRSSKTTDGLQKRCAIRILDLGGHSSCEWAWHAAHEFPHAKVYSAVTENQVVNSGIKGPRNHRTVSVTKLWELPFKNSQFDVISTRSLHALLKTECPTGLDRDEYDLVLKECRRCLKPGGYLEFMLLDAEISHPGPLAAASSVEFAFNLRTRGYDPAASKSFLSRLRDGGFVDIKRAWMYLPMGMEPSEPQIPREAPAPRVLSQIEEYEAVQGPVGSTGDIASITGVLGGWMWEQWLVQLRMEMGRDRPKLLEGIGAMFDEGRKNGAGWTCLSGWAMKPKRRRVSHH